ncbi:uncharacterized protein [Venturia canescens]|uniref:uncharacterized protein n=1 Tax=Venturia canescens TaxID=32260 RepID=UPI001C9C36A1|nr:uncharacterized protein LOC122418312 [Venturia canescens]
MVSLSNIVDETRIGLAFIFIVQCHVCQGKIRFTTDKQHQVEKKNVQGKSRNHYDVDTRAAMGALNGGMGSTHINKILASLNTPPFHLNSYKTHEIEVGTAVEEIARDSCIAATFMERELSIQNIDKLKNLFDNPESYEHSAIGHGFQSEQLFDALRCIFDVLASKTDRFAAGVSSNVNESLNSTIASKAPKSRLYGTTSSGDARLACAIKLPHKKERSEGSQMYQSDMGLLNADMPPIFDIPNNSLSRALVFFDLETGGFSKTADILQIAAKHESSHFSIYINPTQKIDEKASSVSGLRVVAGQLECHRKVVTSVTLLDALLQFYNFLGALQRKCILLHITAPSIAQDF